ncbi:MAG: polyribonucleotide nucleotidyltransferase [Patescibacteria group bacterium]|nr:polyribonucleotide nucleotidyltransferase [Patescibacteria group bacterium]
MSNTKITSKSVTINNKEITIEVGSYAQQASGAVIVTSGETVVQVTVVAGRENPSLGYFPLSVEYREKLYAAGIIKGSRWVKREGKPTDESILKARLIDRSIRPLFPKNYMSEVQVIVSILSYDKQTNPDILGLIGTSAALSISNIPFKGPIAAVRIGTDPKSNLIINPTKKELETSKLDLVVSGSKQAIVMVEAGANEISEKLTIKALETAGEEIKKITEVINQLVKEIGTEKVEVLESKISETDKKEILAKSKSSLDDFIKRLKAGSPKNEIYEIEQAVINQLEDIEPNTIKEVINNYFNQVLRTQLFDKKIRPDGRTTDQVRDLSSKVSLLPRTHGSAMFKRGATQALSVVTLGSPRLEQLIEDLNGETKKRYIHHYNFPPFCVGETGRIGWPKRREIGHGALAERAIEPMLPTKENFPYTIRVVSEIMSSNGSSSMASVCGSSLSLMDAGVPLKKPVAGIAMGLMKQEDDYTILTDIQGLEDHIGDMDFKVAGTKDGITALQMDIKISGIPFKVLETALNQAKIARLTVLESMAKTLATPRKKLSLYAPKIATLNISVEKIGELIGPGGRQIKEIIKSTECEVNVEDDGCVTITGETDENLNRAVTWVKGLTREIQVGEEFDGTVVRVENYGAFVELLPGRDGMVHISKLSDQFVKNINDVVKIGDSLHVRVTKIDEMNRIDLTTLTPEQEDQARQRQQSSPQRSSGNFNSRRSRQH